MQSSAETPTETPAPDKRMTNAARIAPKVVAVPKETQKALEKLVVAQLDAIRKRDYAAALESAMPTMRRQWTPASFKRMIEMNFALLPDSVTQYCQTARSAGSAATMLVRMTGKTESAVGACVYSFGKTDDQWYITGCSPVISPDPSGRSYPSTMNSLRLPNGDLDSVRGERMR